MSEINRKLGDASSHERAQRSVKRAFQKVVEQHRRSGQPIAVLRDGKVIWVSAEEFASNGLGRLVESDGTENDQ